VHREPSAAGSSVGQHEAATFEEANRVVELFGRAVDAKGERGAVSDAAVARAAENCAENIEGNPFRSHDRTLVQYLNAFPVFDTPKAAGLEA
jgi:hypothetical protein